MSRKKVEKKGVEEKEEIQNESKKRWKNKVNRKTGEQNMSWKTGEKMSRRKEATKYEVEIKIESAMWCVFYGRGMFFFSLHAVSCSLRKGQFV